MSPNVFNEFLEVFSDRVCELIKNHIQRVPFSLLGALYFDKCVRELKNFFQSLSEKPLALLPS